MTFDELLKRVDQIVTKYPDRIMPTDAAAIVFSHWAYSMDQDKLDAQMTNMGDLQTVLSTQRELLASLKEPVEKRQPWL